MEKRRHHDIADARIEIEEALSEPPKELAAAELAIAAAQPAPWRRAVPWRRTVEANEFVLEGRQWKGSGQARSFCGTLRTRSISHNQRDKGGESCGYTQ